MTPAHLPVDPAVLRAAVVAAWPGASRDVGVYDGLPTVGAHGLLGAFGSHAPFDRVRLALRNLADALEDAGYVVEGGRVLGVAVVALSALDPGSPQREAWERGIRVRRTMRDAARGPAPNAKIEGARARYVAAHGRGAGR